MPIPEVDTIWMNGELVPWDEAKVHVLTHALHYGSGVFEGIRATTRPKGPAVLPPRRSTSSAWSARPSSTTCRCRTRWSELYDATFATLAANKLDAATSARWSSAATARWACSR